MTNDNSSSVGSPVPGSSGTAAIAPELSELILRLPNLTFKQSEKLAEALAPLARKYVGEVDWQEIAEGWLETAREVTA